MLKKMHLLSIFILFVLFGHAQSRTQSTGGRINVFSPQEPFYVYVNDILYNERPTRQVSITDLKDAAYNLRVEFEGRTRRLMNLNGIQVFNENGAALDLTYSISNQSRTGSKLFLFSMFPVEYPPIASYYETYTYGLPKKQEYNQIPVGTVRDQLFPEVMTNEEFNGLLRGLGKENFDEDKLKIVGLVIPEVSFTVAQIREIMKRFGWDDAKLDFAKKAYANCSDKRNYSSLFDLFTFSDTKQKLIQFIEKNKVR